MADIPVGDWPDEQLPDLTMSLADFVRQAQALCLPNKTKEFLDLVLAGRVVKEGIQYRALIDPVLRTQRAHHSLLYHRRDYDSCIGITSHLPYTAPIAIWPVPPFKQTLTTDNHMRSIAWKQVSLLHLPSQYPSL